MDKKGIELLEAIKKLLILNLVTKGVPGKSIAAVLGVDPAVISRVIAVRKKRRRKVK